MIYLSKELCKLLRAWQKESAWEKKQRGRGGLEEEDYLFRQPGGDPMVPGTFTFRFKKILREGNLPDNLNAHSLWHTNASMLIAQGVDVRTVAGPCWGTHSPAPHWTFTATRSTRTKSSHRRNWPRRWDYRGKGKPALGIPRAGLVRLTGLEPAAFRVGEL